MPFPKPPREHPIPNMKQFVMLTPDGDNDGAPAWLQEQPEASKVHEYMYPYFTAVRHGSLLSIRYR